MILDEKLVIRVLKDIDLFSLYKKYSIYNLSKKLPPHMSISQLFMFSFVWSKTNEGDKFWERIHYGWENCFDAFYRNELITNDEYNLILRKMIPYIKYKI